MVATKINNRKLTNQQRGNGLNMKTHYNSFDEEAVTLATASTLSMSSSEDYNLILEEHPAPKRSQKSGTKIDNRWCKKNQQQLRNTNTSNYNNNSTNTKRKGNVKNSKRVSKATSTKTHDAPMKRRDIYFALDCEMVGVGPEGLDSALARVSIVNWDNEIVLDTYVKVDQPVTDYRTFVSGIRPEQIESDSAMSLIEVQRLVTSTLQGKILIGHGLNNDLKVMGINHPWCDIRDTATYEPFMRVQESRSTEEKSTLCPRKLKDLVSEKLGKQIQVMGKAHSPVEDAVAAMDLYKAVRSEWEMEMMRQVNRANQANEERCQRISFQKMSIMEISNAPLFPSQYTPAPAPQMQMTYPSSQFASFCNHQSSSYQAAAESQARYRAALAFHNQMMVHLHC